MSWFKPSFIWISLPFLLVLFGGGDVSAHGISEDAKTAMLEGGYLQYVWLGASHMLSGYDHLLFLFGVIFFLKTFGEIGKFVSIFTLGHSITLIFATFTGITANYYLVDAVIALSVIYKGFDNLQGFPKVFKTKSPNILWMVLVFGLIHGFGLSTRLQQLPLGEDSFGLFIRIISFNLGVELGQILALVFMLLFVNIWRKRKSFSVFAQMANYALLVSGFLLFLFQLHGYLHTAYPDDFGFSEDNHYHHHENIETERLREIEEQRRLVPEHDSF